MTQRLKLQDGRSLAYTAFGADDGPVVVVLDGPGSRALAQAMGPAAREEGVRVIAPDRPGFGGSTVKPGRAIADWPADHAALLDALGVERAGIVAQSGGTPYALAAAATLPQRTSGLALLGALSPLGEPDALEDVAGPMLPAFKLARRAPWLLKPLMRLVSRQSPEKAAKRMADGLPPADAKVLEDPALYAIHLAATGEIFGHPVQLSEEIELLAKDWDIDLAKITCPVAFWSGDQDVTHPTVMSRRMAARLGGAPIHVVPDTQTFGLMAHYPEALRFAAG